MEAKESLCTIIEAVQALNESSNASYIIDLVLGRETMSILENNQEDLEVFGSGEGENQDFWQKIIDEGIKQGYLTLDNLQEDNLCLTKAGKKFFRNPVSFQVKSEEEEDYDDEEAEDINVPTKNVASLVADPALLSLLKAFRRKKAQSEKVNATVIFLDDALEAMTSSYPTTAAELKKIPGVTTEQVKNYGSDIYKLIRSYCEENEIEIPSDVITRTKAKSKGLKVEIIKGIDRKIALDDLAISLSIDFDEMMNQIDDIVESGVKLNIDYFLNDIMDAEFIDEVYDHFKNSKSKDMDGAINELGDVYSEDEIRLVRIKYLSDRI